MIAIVIGAGLGLLLVAWARRRSVSRERRVYAVGLVVAAGLYVAFAVRSSDPAWIGLEVAGLAAFAFMAWLGYTRSRWWLTVGWLVHVIWDIGLHGGGEPAFVPAWYPLLCAGFDPVVAGAAAWRRSPVVDGAGSARYAP